MNPYLICPSCGSDDGMKNGTTRRGKQNYKCRVLEQAEKLLRQGNRTVVEVAMQVGYGHLGHFATAFKRQFGITPSQCLAGHKIVN